MAFCRLTEFANERTVPFAILGFTSMNTSLAPSVRLVQSGKATAEPSSRSQGQRRGRRLASHLAGAGVLGFGVLATSGVHARSLFDSVWNGQGSAGSTVPWGTPNTASGVVGLNETGTVVYSVSFNPDFSFTAGNSQGWINESGPNLRWGFGQAPGFDPLLPSPGSGSTVVIGTTSPSGSQGDVGYAVHLGPTLGPIGNGTSPVLGPLGSENPVGLAVEASVHPVSEGTTATIPTGGPVTHEQNGGGHPVPSTPSRPALPSSWQRKGEGVQYQRFMVPIHLQF